MRQCAREGFGRPGSESPSGPEGERHREDEPGEVESDEAGRRIAQCAADEVERRAHPHRESREEEHPRAPPLPKRMAALEAVLTEDPAHPRKALDARAKHTAEGKGDDVPPQHAHQARESGGDGVERALTNLPPRDKKRDILGERHEEPTDEAGHEKCEGPAREEGVHDFAGG